MTRHLLLVTTKAAEGRDDEYHTWYDQVHVADVLAIPGVIGAQRFDTVPTGAGDQPPAEYLAVYELDREPAEVVTELMARFGDGRMKMSDAMDLSATKLEGFTARGERITPT
jgi:hypothetical protein